MARKPYDYYEIISIGDWSTKREVARMRTRRIEGRVIPKATIKSMIRRKFKITSGMIRSIDGPVSGTNVDYVVWLHGIA